MSVKTTLCAIATGLCLVSPVQAFDWPSGHTRTVLLQNRCSETMKVVVVYSPSKDVWKKAGWFEMRPGEQKFPNSNGARLQHRDNATFRAYMRSANDRFEIKGDHGTNFRGEHLKTYRTSRLFRGRIVEIRLNC